MRRTFARFPDLKDRIRSGEPPPLATGWFALAKNGVAVPTLDDARRCALVGVVAHEACTLRVTRFDPPHATVIVGRGSGTLTIHVDIDPAFPEDQTPVLVV